MTTNTVETLGISADGQPVLLDRASTNVEYHLLETPNLLELVREVVPTIKLTGSSEIVVERDFGRFVGTTNLVETTESDTIVYAKRIGRNTYSRFALNKQPLPCSSIVVVVRKTELGYCLWTAMCARLLPEEAWVEGSQFNQTHAMAYDEDLIQLNTLTRSKPQQ